jgi:predicted regulator of amino acid metabolism with ACT domain|tara:strand:- start:649 stop:873 length:225 start_codon:yes stop_codon:yes gene_type:complete
MRVNQLLKKNVVDTTAFNNLSPQHKDVVNDFYNQVNYDNNDVVREVETTIDKVALKHNVNTDVVYDYIDKEIGE